MSDVYNVFSTHHEDDTADAIEQAATIQGYAQKEALEYLKQREEIPQRFRDQSLKILGGLYGMEGGEGSQEEMIQKAIESPLYKQLLQGREAGEESILRNMAATGKLRSGNIKEALYDYNVQLENQALLQAYNEQLSGIQGLAGLPSNANTIANYISGIGETSAQGIVAAAQAQAAEPTFGEKLASFENKVVNVGSSVAGGMFSDRRLKKNIKKIGEKFGHDIYSFEWNGIANMLGLYGKTIGCMADEVFERCKEAVFFKNDFLMVNYIKIGIL